MLDNFFLLLMSSADLFFSNYFFSSKKSFRNTIRVSKSLDPDQDQCSVDLDPSCLQSVISKRQTSRLARKDLKYLFVFTGFLPPTVEMDLDHFGDVL